MNMTVESKPTPGNIAHDLKLLVADLAGCFDATGTTYSFANRPELDREDLEVLGVRLLNYITKRIEASSRSESESGPRSMSWPWSYYP